MKKKQSLEEGDQKILDILSHHGSLEFIEMWYEIGEDDALKTQIMNKEDALKRLEFLETQGFVERLLEEEESTLWALKKGLKNH